MFMLTNIIIIGIVVIVILLNYKTFKLALSYEEDEEEQDGK